MYLASQGTYVYELVISETFLFVNSQRIKQGCILVCMCIFVVYEFEIMYAFFTNSERKKPFYM